MEIPGYKIEREIGKGGMASVYLARHLGLDRLVAIKVMHRHLIDLDSSFSDRFLREARISANLTHQNIVTVYDVGVHESSHYIAMEYLPGGITLDTKIRDGLDRVSGLSAIKQIAAALGFAHKHGFVHRDVKPDNIIFREDGSAVLADFGIARAETSDTKMTAIGSMVGTPHYMSPEQAQGREVGACSDIYSLGVVLFEVLTGEVPYDSGSTMGTAWKHITDSIPILPDELQAYQPIVNRVLAKTPKERYETCAQVIADLNDIEISNDAVSIKKMSTDDAMVARDTSLFTNTATVAGSPTARHTSLFTNEAAVDDATVVRRMTSFTAFSGDNVAESSLSKPKKKYIAAVISIAMLLTASVGAFLYYQSTSGNDILAQKKQAESQAEMHADKIKEDELAKKREQDEALQKAKVKAENDEQVRLTAIRKKEERQQLAQEEKARVAKVKADKIKAEQLAVAKEAATNKTREEKKNKIAKLIASAGLQLTNNQLDEAYASYSRALKLDSKNKRAAAGVSRVAEQYLVLANSTARKSNFVAANNYVASAAEIDPENPKIFETKQKILELEREQKNRLEEQKRLAAEASKKIEIQRILDQTANEDVEPEPVSEKKKRRSFGSF